MWWLPAEKLSYCSGVINQINALEIFRKYIIPGGTMNQLPHQPVSIELDQKDCLELLNLLGTYGKNKGGDWDLWAIQINKLIQASLDKSPMTPKVIISFDEINWKTIYDIIQNSCKDLGGEWPQWSQKIGQLINDARQLSKMPPPPQVTPSSLISTKPQCPNCKSFKTVRHKTDKIIWGWLKIVTGFLLVELFIPALLVYWGIYDLIKASKIPSNVWLCKNCHYTWVHN
jgi:hypothetical protein